MSVEKILVEHFNILEYHDQIAIELPFKEEPFETADFLYDGRNCAVLIRNSTKAFILTNIAFDLRQKMLSSKPLIIVEAIDKEVYAAYPVQVTNINIPFTDRLQEAINQILDRIVQKYGRQSLDLMMKKLWPETSEQTEKRNGK